MKKKISFKKFVLIYGLLIIIFSVLSVPVLQLPGIYFLALADTSIGYVVIAVSVLILALIFWLLYRTMPEFVMNNGVSLKLLRVVILIILTWVLFYLLFSVSSYLTTLLSKVI